MKKAAFLIVGGLMALQKVSATDVVTRDMARLPQAARELIDTHFASEKVSYVKIDEEILTTTYEVVFVSGSEIEFVENGVWKEIDCHHSAVPMSVVPEKIAAYVQQNFPGVVINKIEKDKHYELELSNHLDLYFDRHYNFVGIDD